MRSRAIRSLAVFHGSAVFFFTSPGPGERRLRSCLGLRLEQQILEQNGLPKWQIGLGPQLSFFSIVALLKKGTLSR